jgi:hypothetical protein
MTLSPDVNNPAQNGQPGAQAYPPQPPQSPQSAGRKVSAPWTGALLALGALVGGIATFLPFEKIILFRAGTPISTATFTGFGSRSDTGNHVLNISAANGGKIILASAIVGLVCGLVIVAGKGRLWASIIGLLAVLVGGSLAAAEFSAVKDDQKTLNKGLPQGWLVHAITKIGVDVASIGLGVAVIAAILAICIRRRRAA